MNEERATIELCDCSNFSRSQFYHEKLAELLAELATARTQLEQHDEMRLAAHMRVELDAARTQLQAAEWLIARQLGECTGCTTGPEETCPRDGRTYNEWVEIARTVIGRQTAVWELVEEFESRSRQFAHIAQERALGYAAWRLRAALAATDTDPDPHEDEDYRYLTYAEIDAALLGSVAADDGTANTEPRAPRPCPTCGRMGACADCCCMHPSHRRKWPSPAKCPLCKHATRDTAATDTPEPTEEKK